MTSEASCSSFLPCSVYYSQMPGQGHDQLKVSSCLPPPQNSQFQRTMLQRTDKIALSLSCRGLEVPYSHWQRKIPHVAGAHMSCGHKPQSCCGLNTAGRIPEVSYVTGRSVVSPEWAFHTCVKDSDGHSWPEGERVCAVRQGLLVATESTSSGC